MNDQRLGAAFRVLRRRHGWRQRDLGAAAGVSQSVISRIEAGHVGDVTVATLRAVAAALDAMLELELHWRGGALDRLLDERHAGLVGETVSLLHRHSWQTEVEISYSHFGERGSMDIVAWHAATETMLVVEVKTELHSIEGTLRKLDEKVRLAPIVLPGSSAVLGATRPESQPRRLKAIGRLLVLPATTTSRRRLAQHARVLDVGLPMRGTDIRAWIRRPVGASAGVVLIPEGPHMRPGDAKRGIATPHRIRRPASPSTRAADATDRH